VEIVDDGGGHRATGTTTGVGIRGMRERAEATGGRLEAGPQPNGGFRVRAAWGSP
jgi:signal transduction histidine kinase